MAKPAKPKEHVNKYKLVPLSEPRSNRLDLSQALKSKLPPEQGRKAPNNLRGANFIDQLVDYISQARPNLLLELETNAKKAVAKNRTLSLKQAFGRELATLIAKLGLNK